MSLDDSFDWKCPAHILNADPNSDTTSDSSTDDETQEDDTVDHKQEEPIPPRSVRARKPPDKYTPY